MKFNDLKIPKNGAKALLQWLYPATWMESEGKQPTMSYVNFGWLQILDIGYIIHFPLLLRIYALSSTGLFDVPRN